MTKDIKNKVASVRARLENVARVQGISLDAILTLYMQERLLYRLSVSKYSTNFVLKGGLFIYSYTNFKGRPTQDIDFLAKSISNDLQRMSQVFREICAIEADDEVVFLPDTVAAERIKEDADYEGVRIKIEARLGNIRKRVQLDIGFGDVIVPKPQMMQYPVLLDNEAPTIQAYSLEAVVAEKFEAMISLGELNSRMKDFYDIHLLSGRYEFDGRILYEAIFETLQRRCTPIEREPVIFESVFRSPSKERQWHAFVKRQPGISLDFNEALDGIEAFLHPVYEAFLKENEFFGHWHPESGQWGKAI